MVALGQEAGQASFSWEGNEREGPLCAAAANTDLLGAQRAPGTSGEGSRAPPCPLISHQSLRD